MRILLMVIAAGALTACSGGVGGDGPDEFGVVPSRNLALPASLSDLPAPTPGAPNLADLDPDADAAAALGGRLTNGGIPASDSAIVAHANRFGASNTIRATLFAEDERFRSRAGRTTLFGNSEERYYRIYASQALDAAAELARFRARGVRVPTAPPE